MPQNMSSEYGPDWYSGGGEYRKSDGYAESIKRHPEIANLVRGKAHELGIPVGMLQDYMRYIADNSFFNPSQVADISPLKIEGFRAQLAESPDLMRHATSTYRKEPGALKYIADLGKGHLDQRIKEPYQKYNGPRIAEFEAPQRAAHRQVESLNRGNFQNNLRTRNALDSLAETRQGPGAMGAMQPYLNKGTSRIGQAERNPFVQSVRQNVLRPLQQEMTDNLMENIFPRINANRIAAGNLYGGHRTELQSRALKDLNKMLMQESGKHLYQAELHGHTAAEHERERAINAAQLAGNTRGADIGRQAEIARSEQGLMGDQQLRELTALEALSNVGSQQQRMKQQKYDLDYADYLRQQEGIMPEVERYNALVRGMQVPQTRSSFQPQVPEGNIMSQAGGLAMMASGGLWGGKAKQAYKGGRIMLAEGGVASSLNLIKDRLRNLTFAPQSMAGQDVQDTMMDQMMPQDQSMPQDMGQMPQPPMAPPPPAGPIERGSAGALSAMQKMQQQRDKMEQSAGEYENGAHDANPWGSALMHLGAGLAGSSPRLSERLAEGAKGAVAGFEHTQAANKQNEVISQNIRKSLLDTYQKEHENDMKQKQALELAQIKANTPKAPKMYYNKKTGTHYTLDENGQMVVAPGAPKPITPEAALADKSKELRMEEEVKGEQANVNKLREIANKSQASIGNYGTVKRLLEGSGVSKYMGPIKGKFFQSPKVQALMSGKSVTAIQEFNGAINKVVLDDIKMMGANPSDRDVRIVENSKPSPTDTPEGALRKALINEAAQRRMQDFANFTNEMWSKYGIRSFESQKAYNSYMQDNPQFNETGDEILNPHGKPEDYLDNEARAKAGLPPKEESINEGTFQDVEEPIKSNEPSQLKGNLNSLKKQAKRDAQQIRAALMLKRAGMA